MKYCADAWLVSLEYELPADRSIANPGTPKLIGCNHLVCRKCGAEVRHADHRSIPAMYPPDDLRSMYDAGQVPPLDSRPIHSDSRAYYCRCDWASVEFSGAKLVEQLDQQEWRCAGHGGSGGGGSGGGGGGKAAVASMAAAVDVAGAKIRFAYAANVNPAFSTAAELRDCLLASYPDAAHFGGPVVGKNLEDTAPAWGWAAELIGMRSDWWPALGIALQHAVVHGDELARVAFATFLADYRDSFALLPWTAPLAEAESFDAVAPGSGTGWGMPDCRIDSIIRDQQASFAEIHGATEQFLYQYGKNATNVKGPFTREADLRALLEKSARAGQFPYGTRGPWSWVGPTLIVGDDWLRPALVHSLATIDVDDEPMVLAMLDWFSEERDLWQFVSLLDRWDAQHPSWWDQPADTKPAGWARTMRSAHWPDVSTLGDVVVEANRRAKLQIATPPVVDLPLLYGAAIS